MNQHPVPQNVTQYQFRLVGDMTLKQFLELASGLILAILFYSSNLLIIFKWPLILLSVFFGIALAFFPIEDRPLDQWIINFINSIYKPTRFIWKKTDKVPSIFTFTAHAIAPTNTITKTIKAPSQKPKLVNDPDLSEIENSQISSLNSLFSSTPAPVFASATPQKTADVIYDKPSITVRKLKPVAATQAPPPTPPKPLSVPLSDAPVITHDSTPSSSPAATVPDNLIFASTKASPPTHAQAPATTKLTSISLPVAPRSPNLIVGVTTDKDGKLIEGAIVQVLDNSGLPARAMKTNALGQFATSTPLSPGTYRIEVEADGSVFTPQVLVINNTIVKPFEIRATS